MTEANAQMPARSSASRIASAVLIVIGGLLWCIPLATVVIIAPKFQEIFAKFEMKEEVPSLTSTLINIAHVVQWLGFIIVPVGVVGVGLLAVACARPRTRRGLLIAIIFAGASFVVVTILETVLTVGLFLPWPFAGFECTGGLRWNAS